MQEYTIDKYKEFRKLMFKDRQTHIDEEGDYWAVGNMGNYTGAVKGIAIDKLAELEDKIENGELVELPCKVGDKVYWVFELVKNKLEILEGKIRGLSISQNNTSWFSVIYEYGLTFEHTFKDYWNKTVFLTKADAEKKLKEQQNER